MPTAKAPQAYTSRRDQGPRRPHTTVPHRDVDGKPPANRPLAPPAAARAKPGGRRKEARTVPRPARVLTITQRRIAYTAPWAYNRCAPGVPPLRAGRTQPLRAGRTQPLRAGRTHCRVPGSDSPRQCTPRTVPIDAKRNAPARPRVERRSRPRHGQAPGWRRKEARLSLGVPAARRGRTHQTQRPYLHRAMGTVAVRAGRTHPARLGVLTLRAGRTHPARRGSGVLTARRAPRHSTYSPRSKKSARTRRSTAAPWDAVTVDDGGKHAAPWPTQRSPWAYRSVLTKRRGRTYTAPWVRSRYAPGIVAPLGVHSARAGRTRRATIASAGPHRTNTAPSTTKRPTPEPHNDKAHAEFAQVSTTARPRPGRGSGLTTEESTPLPGPTQRSPWAYRSRAVGVLTKRRGRTYTAPWVPSRYAPGILATHPGRTQRALGVLSARRSHSAGPHRANTAPSTTKTPTPEPHNRHPGGQRACATQQVFAAQAKPSDQNRTTAKAEGPRGPRREHGHGRALDAFMVTRAQQHRAVGVPTARRGRTSRPPQGVPTARRGRTRRPPLGVLAARRGHTNRPPWAYSRTRHAPWAYSPRALGALARRPGRTRPGPRSDSAGRHSTNAAHRRQSRSPRRARRGRRHRRAKGAVRIERGRNHVSPYAPCA